MTPDEPKRTIDERLETIAQTLEIVSHMQHRGARSVSSVWKSWRRTTRNALIG
jgi:hypothetical protein